jgi:hypothetical protein
MTTQALEGVDQPCGCDRIIKVAPFYWRSDTHTRTQHWPFIFLSPQVLVNHQYAHNVFFEFAYMCLIVA